MKKLVYMILPVILFGCHSDDIKDLTKKNSSHDNDITEQVGYNVEFFSESQQNYSFHSAKGIDIRGLEGTKISIPKYCFGEYEGIVKVKLVEVYDINEMLKLNLSTTTGNDLILETGGMIFFQPYDSTGAVLHPKNKYVIEFSKNRNSKMKLFKSERKNLEETPNWELLPEAKKPPEKKVKRIRDGYYGIPPDGDTIFYESEIESFEEQYIFETLHVGWLNCDMFLEFDDLIVQSVDVKAHINEDYTYFIVFENYNSLIARKPDSKGNLKFRYVPNKEPVYCMALSINSGEVKFGIENIELSEHNEVRFSKIEVLSHNVFNKRMRELFSKDVWSRNTESRVKF